MTISIADPFFYENNNQANEAFIGMQLENQHLNLADENNNILASSSDEEDIDEEDRVMVETFYLRNHKHQTYEFALTKKTEYVKLDKGSMSIWQCCQILNEIDIENDPNLQDFQFQHLLQTAEAIRKDYPHEYWFHLTALIHDLGKIMVHSSFGGLPLWFVVGETFPVGCAFDPVIFYHQLFEENPDSNNPNFNTESGIYSNGCGLNQVVMSWAHDEYMYLVAKGNNTTLPPVALFIIRFHSFNAMHQNGAYTHLMNDQDHEMLKWLQIFNNYDVYEGDREKVNLEEVKPYYISLISKYFPNGDMLKW